MPQDDLDHIPPIVPAHDREQPAARRGGARKSDRGRGGRDLPARASAGRSGAGPLARLLIAVALLAAAAACAWAWQLQLQLQEANGRLADYQRRIGVLEERLSDTDEGMNQNAELQAAKIRELDSEVRKLWDNVWKKSKERLDALEQQSASHGKQLSAAEQSLSAAQAQLQSAAGDLARLKGIAADLERLMASARSNQAEVERVADSLNRIDLALAQLGKRVEGNEEWVASINAFRRQVNADMANLQSSLRALQGAP
jgi:chromosome segregation ATPase